MAHFLIQNIVFDTRTLDSLECDPALALSFQNEWVGNTFDFDDELLEENGLEDSLDCLISFMDFTGWLCHEIELKSLDIHVESPLELVDCWNVPTEDYPIERQTKIVVC